ncbi:hypothetical protein BDZ89DRAFT_1162664 [Hymenopellis radicata]|nr:hypothetical protein BDZ89DRAFT_1162664 [Hymenopellis radicata]
MSFLLATTCCLNSLLESCPSLTILQVIFAPGRVPDFNHRVLGSRNMGNFFGTCSGPRRSSFPAGFCPGHAPQFINSGG